MAFNLMIIFLLVTFSACCSSDCATATTTDMARPLASASNLTARLKLDEESSDCWGSLIQLQACTGEIILFFLNGETQLGHGCCQALHTIGEHCWPNMIGTLGFTTEEGQILEGYCDDSKDPSNVVPKQPLLP
ncbi:hypothetical protein SADUNF_Sadunf09G0061100 [Salix dunnii]|uniref:Prolamin-like domain-containing protein n=1 Tax=Salix dunnii TaxID=1413687 RepID=A0A835MZW3_9ROSI|nr:hypothetical protein SADUNF_Sadunf09G0061100 [Salix dunnii]